MTFSTRPKVYAFSYRIRERRPLCRVVKQGSLLPDWKRGISASGLKQTIFRDETGKDSFMDRSKNI